MMTMWWWSWFRTVTAERGWQLAERCCHSCDSWWQLDWMLWGQRGSRWGQRMVSTYLVRTWLTGSHWEVSWHFISQVYIEFYCIFYIVLYSSFLGLNFMSNDVMNFTISFMPGPGTGEIDLDKMLSSASRKHCRMTENMKQLQSLFSLVEIHRGFWSWTLFTYTHISFTS